MKFNREDIKTGNLDVQVRRKEVEPTRFPEGKWAAIFNFLFVKGDPYKIESCTPAITYMRRGKDEWKGPTQAKSKACGVPFPKY